MSHSDDIPLSTLQHWLFCPRQYALIYVERIWTENRFTAEGRALHERVDKGQPETRLGVRILRSVEVCSAQHGLYGVVDVVELHQGRPYPVEYKRGRPKTHRADEVQLCAQTLCLEEMFQTTIPEGAIFYGTTRRRNVVAFDDDLRALTLDVAAQVRDCRDTARLPPPKYDPARCNHCSLLQDCRPRQFRAGRRVQHWLEKAIEAPGTPE